MNIRTFRKFAVPLLLATLAAPGVLLQAAWADEQSGNYRRYDEKGQYQGSAREAGEGQMRFYDSRGQYSGSARQQDDGSWRTYDAKGQYQGTIRPE